MDLRRSPRVPIDVLVEYTVKGSDEVYGGRARDVSLGGMFVETPDAPPFGASIVVHVILPGGEQPIALPGVVRWTGSDGAGVQFGLLGVRETYEITQAVRSAGGR